MWIAENRPAISHRFPGAGGICEIRAIPREAATCPGGIVKRQVNVCLRALSIDGRRPAKYIGFVDLEKGYPTVGARRTCTRINKSAWMISNVRCMHSRWYCGLGMEIYVMNLVY